MSISEIEKNLNNYIQQKAKSVLQVLEIEGRKSISMNFEQGGRPDKWKPSQKLLKRPSAKTLIAKGNLRSISSQIDVNNSSVKFGLNPLARVYGQIHNEGGTINHPGRRKKSGGRGNPYQIQMPQRRFMVIPESDFPRIINSVRKLF